MRVFYGGDGMSVICWYYDVHPLYDSELFSRGMALLPWEERRAKVMRFHFEKDRCLCLGAGLLLEHALRQAGASDLSLHCLPNGKPVLANEPNIHFNLSHSGTMAVCALSDHPVGVDVEILQKAEPGVMNMCFRHDEQEWIRRSDHPDHAFTRLWTRKESYLKLLGTGLSYPLNAFSVLPGAAMPEDVEFTEHEEAGHLICVCTYERETADFREYAFRSDSGSFPGAADAQ